MAWRMVAVVAVISVWLPWSAFASPELSAPDTEVHFGEILQGTRASHTFVFRNSGESDLRIERVRSSCGCTAALLSNSRLAPGEQGEVEAVFDAGRFRGEVSKNITLHTNAPKTPRATFVVRATVVPEIDFSPPAVDFGALTTGTQRQMSVTVTNRSQREVVLGEPRATGAGVEARMEPGPLRPGESREMTVAADASAPGGLHGYVILRADGAAVPDLRLSVRGRVEAR